eukprot:7172703-Alexandrium_andersonii.AAC.1
MSCTSPRSLPMLGVAFPARAARLPARGLWPPPGRPLLGAPLPRALEPKARGRQAGVAPRVPAG